MTGVPGCTVRLRFHPKDKTDVFQQTGWEPQQQDDDMRRVIAWEIASKLVYGDRAALLAHPFREGSFWERALAYTKSECMVLMYLEEVCYSLLWDSILHDRQLPEEKNLEHFQEIAEPFRDKLYQSNPRDEYNDYKHGKQSLSYQKRREILMNRISDDDVLDKKIAGMIADGIAAIPEEFFRDVPDNRRLGADIRLSEIKENFLEQLMNGLDYRRYVASGVYASHTEVLRVSFEGLSTGEAHYLDFYATLYEALRRFQQPRNAVIVLLLDEPDSRFHPDWSRRFIRDMVDILNPPEDDSSEVADAFRKYRYQVILTSHSPLLMSDVLSDCIHCFGQKNADSASPRQEPVQIWPSRYGFMSSINDMLIDNFFVDSIFGAFAADYTNALIRDMEEMESVLDGESASPTDTDSAAKFRELAERADELRERLAVIQDEIIYLSLSRRLERIQRKTEFLRKKSQERGNGRGGNTRDSNPV